MPSHGRAFFFKVPKDSKVFKVFKKAPFHREKVTVNV